MCIVHVYCCTEVYICIVSVLVLLSEQGVQTANNFNILQRKLYICQICKKGYKNRLAMQVCLLTNSRPLLKYKNIYTLYNILNTCKITIRLCSAIDKQK